MSVSLLEVIEQSKTIKKIVRIILLILLILAAGYVGKQDMEYEMLEAEYNNTRRY